jgi:UDP-GlcNAc3NAcA epimerase
MVEQKCLRVVSLVGARPQFVKVAPVHHELVSRRIEHHIIHSGQHYDEAMSDSFFSDLRLPPPKINLEIGSGSHAAQTAGIIQRLDDALNDLQPQVVLVYGDTNTTLAGALVVAKRSEFLVHIEAGLRSFNRTMPEEINRILCDHVSTLLFTPTKAGLENLYNEGFAQNSAPYHLDNPGVFHCGDVMLDNTLHFADKAGMEILEQHQLEPDNYVLCTIHRNNNTDDAARLTSIFSALTQIADTCPVVLPIHPRTAGLLQKQLPESLYHQVSTPANLHIIPPASFLALIALEKHCRMIITDSGGVQKEAFFFRKPCIILRAQTEWVELVDAGAAVIADADTNAILQSYIDMKNKNLHSLPSFFGDGHAADFIAQTIITHIA